MSSENSSISGNSTAKLMVEPTKVLVKDTQLLSPTAVTPVAKPVMKPITEYPSQEAKMMADAIIIRQSYDIEGGCFLRPADLCDCRLVLPLCITVFGLIVLAIYKAATHQI